MQHALTSSNSNNNNLIAVIIDKLGHTNPKKVTGYFTHKCLL